MDNEECRWTALDELRRLAISSAQLAVPLRARSRREGSRRARGTVRRGRRQRPYGPVVRRQGLLRPRAPQLPLLDASGGQPRDRLRATTRHARGVVYCRAQHHVLQPEHWFDQASRVLGHVRAGRRDDWSSDVANLEVLVSTGVRPPAARHRACRRRLRPRRDRCAAVRCPTPSRCSRSSGRVHPGVLPTSTPDGDRGSHTAQRWQAAPSSCGNGARLAGPSQASDRCGVSTTSSCREHVESKYDLPRTQRRSPMMRFPICCRRTSS